ncbi:unnamed protein product [Clonostachys rosea f. rosea IK726]|uniref:GST N-terminal domain-containing protein n=2 Tax=Bionectria ochroleuca TaxID=29856 RepID=A0A0B7KN03_BIOOC|nr:unnamed protein product [Clonostachys rosea f. rosea IK726]
MAAASDTKIILYTNHRCPWAHRAHIVLSELNIPFEEVIIDLDRPRDPWYLEINPRGLVPSINYNGVILTESGIISQFLADENPSDLLPASNAPGGALKRAQIGFFVDTLFSKTQGHLFKLGSVNSEAEFEKLSGDYVAAVAKEVEPLLKDAGPFFGGSKKLTFAEVLSGSFIVRLLALSSAGVYPASIISGLKEKAPNFYKWAEAVSAHPSVTNIFDKDTIIEGTKARLQKQRSQI